MVKLRKGIALIELIFAIVIMGIVFMAAPYLISQAKSGLVTATKQESISAVASNIEMLLTRQWDEAGTDDSVYPTVLQTEGTNLLNEVGTTGRRLGTPMSSQRTFINSKGDKFDASKTFNDGNQNDIDDANGQVVTLAVYDDNVDGDYIDKDIKMTTSVAYVRATPVEGTFNSKTLNFNNPFVFPSGIGAPTGTTNIKYISVKLTTDNANALHKKSITLDAFSSNIGSYKLDERNF